MRKISREKPSFRFSLSDFREKERDGILDRQLVSWSKCKSLQVCGRQPPRNVALRLCDAKGTPFFAPGFGSLCVWSSASIISRAVPSVAWSGRGRKKVVQGVSIARGLFVNSPRAC